MKTSGAKLNAVGEHCDDTEERYLREMLAMLHKNYIDAARPYIERIAAIQAMRPPTPFIMTKEQVDDLWRLTKMENLLLIKNYPPSDI